MKAFLSPKCVEHEVNEETLKFYPASLQTAFLVKDILRPLVSGIAQLLTDTTGDRGHTSTRQGDFEQIVVNPSNVELSQWRAREKEKAILDFLDAFTEKKTTAVLCRIIMDSLRDDYPRRFEQKDVDNFRDSLDAETFVQLMVGVVKANKGIFGPFAETLKSAVQNATGRLQNLNFLKDEDTPKTIGDESVLSSTSSSQEDTLTQNS